ncbi:myb-like protein X [Vespula squamosa]|uniref:Myb-like protein X n=1 Tax=Vespula squamosa TaxID=30214 RepID=A0ABD2C9Q5_VESSQ
MAVTTNFNKTNMALFYKGLSKRGHGILFSKDPNVDSGIFLRIGDYFIEELFRCSSFYILKRNRRRSRQEEKIKINLNADSVLAYRTNNNLDSTCLKNNRIDKKNLREINEDSTEENLLNSAKVIEEEEEVDEEEEGEEEEKEEEVKDEGKDYEATLVYNSIDDLFYLDNDYSQIYLIHVKTRLISGRS